MPHFTKKTVFILPHAEKYRTLYGVSVEDVLLVLNEPEENEGLAEDKYTVKRTFATYSVLLDYFITLPLQGDGHEMVVIVDYVGYEEMTPLSH